MISKTKNNIECWMFFSIDDDINKVQETDVLPEAISNILNKESSSKYLILRVENMVKDWLKSSISSSQLRKIYNEVKEKKSAEELAQVRPILSYTTARQNNLKARSFMGFLKELIVTIGNEKDVDKYIRFSKFMESVVSYHKYYTNK